ncbi:hypothetical protein [Sulfurospirillum sp. 1612]|uniref:hypothetical protein n=1 Tax=Sulfurospirillum sp. 1612 TaxID=3094835 RepID=UPI002F94711B
MRFVTIFLLILPLWGFESVMESIQNYHVVDTDFWRHKTPYKAIRTWHIKQEQYYLVVNQNNLKTEIIKAPLVDIMKKKTIATPFMALKEKLLKQAPKLHNFGITSPQNNQDFLTIDMCPSSKKGYEKKLFRFLEKSGSVANISISGKWMLGHSHDFDALIKSALKVRWINHSFSHYYDRNEKDWSKNFMLKNPEAFDAEIIKTEKLLIINHQTPSVFFRFPGLISDATLVHKLIKTYNLLPLGTNNWLNVSNKKIEKGEIILVHGNKNEHRGITLFFDQNQSNKYYAPIEEIILK